MNRGWTDDSFQSVVVQRLEVGVADHDPWNWTTDHGPTYDP